MYYTIFNDLLKTINFVYIHLGKLSKKTFKRPLCIQNILGIYRRNYTKKCFCIDRRTEPGRNLEVNGKQYLHLTLHTCSGI